MGRRSSVEGQRLVARRQRLPTVVELEPNAPPFNDGNPALNARVGRERAVLLDVGQRDPQMPAVFAGKRQQGTRGAAAVLPSSGCHLFGIDDSQGRHSRLTIASGAPFTPI